MSTEIMASQEPVARYKHVSLPTQQRRLRHLRMIAARNMGSVCPSESAPDISQLETFFTLHKHSKDKAFYTSERIRGSLNPTWRSFNLENAQSSQKPGVPDMASKFCVVRVWRVSDEETKLCIEWFVYLDGLVYLGDKSQQERLQYPPNTILFGMLDGIYGCPNSPPTWDSTNSQILLDQTPVRESYTTQTLLRIKTILRAIQQTRASVQKVKHSIEERLNHADGLNDKRMEREQHVLKTYSLRRDLDWRLRALHSEKDAYEVLQSENKTTEMEFRARLETLQHDRSELHEKKKNYFSVREDLIKTGAQLVMRRKQLISELAFIYPIVEESNHKDFTICGVRLPNSEDFLGQDETMIAVALGYTCHLVVMISHFLDVPMRYPMEHLGSRSVIRDHIIDKLTDKERDFPLYSKGKEKFQFNYGVYLLNKNIAQLRYYCALGTTDLRMTLPNLKSLLEFRLGVRFESTNAPVLAGQHMAVPPNLGDPRKAKLLSLNHHQQTGTVDGSSSNPQKGKNSPEHSSNHIRTQNDEEHSNESVLKKMSDRTVYKDGIKELSAESGLMEEDVWSTKDYHGSRTRDLNSINVKSSVSADDGLLASHSKQACVMNASVSVSPVIRTLDVLSREKLMGSIANYDDLDVSSSEDSACATYASRFKMWPRDQLDVSLLDAQWIGDESERAGELSGHQSLVDSAAPTFKTKAMLSPSRGVNDDVTKQDCDDLMTVAEQWQKETMAKTVDVLEAVFPRQRTDSSTDGEDSATFVISVAKELAEATPLSDQS